MSKERILITGATGCIGKAVVDFLQRRGEIEFIALSRSGHDEWDSVKADIADRSSVEQAVSAIRPTRIIHLAGFQTPDCQSQPFRGMEVCVHGTNNLLRSAANLGSHLQRFVFASSAAVYGPRSLYPGPKVKEDDGLRPPNLYGHWKVAGEGSTQAFHLETNVPSLSLRLATTYGPGRDLGLTSAPTTAMKAAAKGEGFRMPYRGREHYHFVRDVGDAFGLAALEDFSGYDAFNLRGQSRENAEFIELIRQEAKLLDFDASRVHADPNAEEMPFVCDLDDQKILRSFPTMPLTNLSEGIRTSLEFFSSE